MNQYNFNSNESLPIIPSFHDCEIDDILLESNRLILKLNNLQNYDTIVNQNIENNSCDIVINLKNLDFCNVLYGKEKWKRKSLITRYLSGYNYNVYSVEEFISIFNKKRITLEIDSFLVGPNSIIIKTFGWDKNGCVFDLNASSVNIYWTN